MQRSTQLLSSIALLAIFAALLPAAAGARPSHARSIAHERKNDRKSHGKSHGKARTHRRCRRTKRRRHHCTTTRHATGSPAARTRARRHTPVPHEQPSSAHEATAPSTPTPPPPPLPGESPAEVPVTPVITGTTYYVSPSGSDANSGTSPSSPWRTLKRVNESDLAPGDGVLFEGGATFGGEALMPSSSGQAGSPIVYASYGAGNAKLPDGVWFRERSYLTFAHLTIIGTGGVEGQGIQGTGNDVVVEWCSIGDDGLPINAAGTNSSWAILANTIDHSGNSGMLLEGEHFTVSGNTITETGLDPAIAYGKHGIYLKVSNATVTNNTITNFNTDGISVRYRNSVVRGNHIEDGPVGIAWFQYDPTAGTSYWTQNTITGTTVAGIYVSASNEHGGNTRESFVIEKNTITPAAGVFMNLEATSGAYSLLENAEI